LSPRRATTSRLVARSLHQNKRSEINSHDQYRRREIQSYLDGLHEGDAAKIAAAFHPTSALTSISEAGELAITPRDVWLENVRNRPSPKQRSLSRHDEVLSIDLVGPTMAYVKLKCAIPPRFFTDQLSLLKIDGRWQIAQKVFMTELRD
jgi:hypothetical protein